MSFPKGMTNCSPLSFTETSIRGRIAAQALINIGDADRHLASPMDTNALLEALDDEDDDVRYFVAVALGKLEVSLSLGKLKQLARDDASALVREGAKIAVEQIESCLS